MFYHFLLVCQNLFHYPDKSSQPACELKQRQIKYRVLSNSTAFVAID